MLFKNLNFFFRAYPNCWFGLYMLFKNLNYKIDLDEMKRILSKIL